MNEIIFDKGNYKLKVIFDDDGIISIEVLEGRLEPAHLIDGMIGDSDYMDLAYWGYEEEDLDDLEE